MDTHARITELEIKITELERLAHDLSDVIADQAKELARAKTQIAHLYERARAEEADGSISFTDAPPPHY